MFTLRDIVTVHIASSK